MRLALVIGSGYERNGQVASVSSADFDSELVERRLLKHDAGFRVVRFRAERGLADQIEQRLLAQREPIEEILLYFSGYCAVSSERGPALLLDGERLGTFAMARLRKLVENFSPASCVVMDVTVVVEEGQTLESAVHTIGEVLAGNGSTVSVLLAARRNDAGEPPAAQAFTSWLLTALDWLAASRSADQSVDLSWLFEGLRADHEKFAAIPVVLFFPQHRPFVILPPYTGAVDEAGLPRFDDGPPELEPERHESFVGSESWAPLPSFASADGSEAESEPEPTPTPPPPPPPLEVVAPEAEEEISDFEVLSEAMPVEPEVTPARLPSLQEAFHEPAPASEPTPLPSFAEGDTTDSFIPAFSDDEPTPLPSFAPPHAIPSLNAVAASQPPAVPTFAPSADVADELFAAGELERATDEYEAVLALLEEPTERARLRARHARALIRIGRRGAAANLLDQADEQSANHPELAAVRRELLNGSRPTPPPPVRSRSAGPPPPPVRSKPPPVAYVDIQELEALAESGDAGDVQRAAAAVEDLSRSAAVDPLRHAALLERLVPHAQEDLALCDRLVDLYRTAQHPERALEHCRRAARLLPTRAITYRRALSLFEAMGARDGAWNAAAVLESLGEADVNEALLAGQHRANGLFAARSALVYGEWQSVLLAGKFDPRIWDVLEALGPAAVRVGRGFLKQHGRHSDPDPAFLHDPEKSTTTLAKTLGWTARLFGLQPPVLYVLPELAAGFDVGATETASALASRALASGLEPNQLAFLWGRQVPRFRNELRSLGFFRSPEELVQLLSAALALGEAGAFMRGLDGEAKRVYAALRREVQGTALDRLKAVARGFSAVDLRERVQLSLRGVELMGVRAGLIACGDVAIAAELVRRHPLEGLTRVSEQLAELYAFSISDAYAGLRRRIGAAIAD